MHDSYAKFRSQNLIVDILMETGMSKRKVCQSSGSIQVSGKRLTYPSLKLTLTLTSYLGQNVSLREGRAVSQKPKFIQSSLVGNVFSTVERYCIVK